MPATDHAPLMLSVSGCRGITGASFTPETIARYAHAWADDVRAETTTERPTIVVGRDGRAGGGALQRLVEGALNAAGCDTVGLGTATTPTVGLMVRRLDAHAGLVLTASHNPAEWNGLKPITRAGAAPTPARMKGLIERYHANANDWRTWDALGTHTERTDSAALHVRTVLDAVARVCDPAYIASRRFSVIADSVNASGVEGCRLLLSELGCDLTHLNDDDSGLFPHPPEPTEDNLKGLAEAVGERNADAAFAQDTDADRLAILGPGGVYIGEEYTLVLCATALLESMGNDARGAVLCANLSTSRMIDDVAAKYGATVVRTPVGEANVSSVMVERAASLGGEGNGGVIWPDVVLIRDSLASMALVLALMARTGRTIEELVADVPRYAIVKTKAPITEALRDDAPRLLTEAFAGADVDTQDGVRFDFDTEGGRGWLHARPSNTEPVFRLIAEAPTGAGANAIIARAQRALARS
ncbi:MAG: phosphoglucosamine mutase [Planctomycetota bacterium]